ncbi:unnamed protein product, partial [Oikopleura dioica]
MFKEISLIWKHTKTLLFRISREEKRNSEILINFNAIADVTGFKREDLVGLDIEELEILWKRCFLLPETTSLSSNSIMQHILDEEKHAEALAAHEIDDIVLDLECLEGGSSSSDNGETKMNDFVCLGQLGSACEAQSIKSEIDIYK